jgi:hypothetical protein
MPNQQAGPEKFSTKLIRMILRRLIFIIPTMIITWIIHTYVIVVMNDGFGDSTIWGRWVNTVGNMPSAMVVWGLISAMIWSLIYSTFKFGPVKAVSSFIKAPFWIYRLLTGSGKTGFGAFLMGVGLAAILSSVFQFKVSANIILALALSLVGLSQPGFLLATFFAKGWMRVAGNLSKSQPEKYALSLRGAHLLVVGLSPGFICAAILSARFAQGFGIIAIIVGIILFFNIQAPRASAGQISGLLIFGTLTALLYALYAWLLDNAFADDGGGKECGSSFQSWVKCQGAGMAVARGAPPSLASGAGVLAPPLNIVDPSKITISMTDADMAKLYAVPTDFTIQPGGSFTSGGTQEAQFGLSKGEIQDHIDYRRGYHVNPDGSWTAIGYRRTGADTVVTVLTVAQTGCDVSVSTLSNMTGPVGKGVNYGYIGLKNIGKDMSAAHAEGRPLSEGFAQGVFDAGVDATIDYAGGKLMDKVGFTSECPNLKDVSVKDVYKVATGQATRENITGIGLDVTKRKVSGQVVKDYAWNATVRGEATDAAFQTGKKALAPVLGSSLRGGLGDQAFDQGLTGPLQEFGWNAIKNMPTDGETPKSFGWRPTDQLER